MLIRALREWRSAKNSRHRIKTAELEAFLRSDSVFHQLLGLDLEGYDLEKVDFSAFGYKERTSTLVGAQTQRRRYQERRRAGPVCPQ